MQRLAALTALASGPGAWRSTPAPPAGPSVMALPPQGKPFDQFQREDYNCRVYADQVMGGVSAQQAAANAGVGSAALGTALGAGLGAAIGLPAGPLTWCRSGRGGGTADRQRNRQQCSGSPSAFGAAVALGEGPPTRSTQRQYAFIALLATTTWSGTWRKLHAAYAAAAPGGYPSGYGYAPVVVAGPTVVVGGGWGGGWGWGGGPYGWHRGWGLAGPRLGTAEPLAATDPADAAGSAHPIRRFSAAASVGAVLIGSDRRDECAIRPDQAQDRAMVHGTRWRRDRASSA
ncbi:MAG: hypothetical protein U1E70_14355 [Acetobacteraceae bacterium]